MEVPKFKKNAIICVITDKKERDPLLPFFKVMAILGYV